jgi:hypothetical protein
MLIFTVLVGIMDHACSCEHSKAAQEVPGLQKQQGRLGTASEPPNSCKHRQQQAATKA